MKPAPFRYYAPTGVEEALELLDQHGDEAKPLAGGQSLVPAMNFRLARPAVLVDLNRIPKLAYLEERGDGSLAIGAMTRQRTLERAPLVARASPLLAETLPHIAHHQIRNRGTLGGSLAHADPAAELPAVALVLDAELVLRGTSGERTVAARDFYLGLFETALRPGELLVEVVLPPPRPRSGFAFEEVARRHGDYALVGVAASLTLDDAGAITHAKLGILSVGETPWDAASATDLLHRERPSEALFRAAAAAAADAADPPGDIHASPAFRRHLIGVLVERVLRRACDRAG
jgi:carbon-monoxide dehydrogenase medium subunit